MFRPRRLGCLGSIVALAILAPLAYLGPVAIFAPWAYSLGGHYHVLPTWEGVGRAHSPSEGDYLLYVYLYPVPGNRPGSGLGRVTVSGMAQVCSPRGVVTKLKLGGDMDRDVWADANGRSIHLWLRRFDVGNYSFNTDRRPHFDLYGQWHYPALEADDRGTLSQAFNADGSVNRGHQSGPRWMSHVTLQAGKASEFAEACKAVPAVAARQ
jgi:hypothetical protein